MYLPRKTCWWNACNIDAFTFPPTLFSVPNFGNALTCVLLLAVAIGGSCLTLDTKVGGGTATGWGKAAGGGVCFVVGTDDWGFVGGTIAVVPMVEAGIIDATAGDCTSTGDGLLCVTNRCSISCSYQFKMFGLKKYIL